MVRGPNIFPRYFWRPDAVPRAVTPAGWFRTPVTPNKNNPVSSTSGYVSIVEVGQGAIIKSTNAAGSNVYPR